MSAQLCTPMSTWMECFSWFQSIPSQKNDQFNKFHPVGWRSSSKKQSAKYQNRMICIPLPARFQLCILNYFQIKSLFKYLLTEIFIQLQINHIFRTKRSFKFWLSFHSCLNAVKPSPAMERSHALHRQLPSAAPSTFWPNLMLRAKWLKTLLLNANTHFSKPYSA